MDFGGAYKGVIPAKAGIHELKLQEDTASVRLHLTVGVHGSRLPPG